MPRRPRKQIIYGPPGTGKSTYLMSVMEKELSLGIPKNKIAFVTFTQQGAEVGMKYAIHKFGGDPSQYPYFRTLHSLAFRELGMRREEIMTKKHYKDFSLKMGMHFLGFYTEEGVHGDDKYLFFDQLVRNNPKEGLKYKDELNPYIVNFVSTNYRKYKKVNSIVDFTDLLEAFIAQNIALDIDVAIIDEAQDLTTLQWRMVNIATRNAKRIYIAGDDDQAIFSWAGADIDYFLNLSSDLPPIYLNHSWRLPDSVLEVAEKVVNQIETRVNKQYTSRGVSGYVFFVNSIEEVFMESNKSYLFLVRNSKYISIVRKFLERRGIPYTLNGEALLKLSDIKTIRQWEELRNSSTELPEFLTPIGKNLNKNANIADPWYNAFDWPEETIDYYISFLQGMAEKTWDSIEEYVRKHSGKNTKIRVSTIHRAKGTEADNVVVMLDITTRTHKEYMRNSDNENRVLYVGVTRAREKLILVNTTSKWGYKIF